MEREWGDTEDGELICERGKLHQEFITSKGNAVREARLWELVSSHLSFQATGIECKSRWKQLIPLYKAEKQSPQNFPLEIDAIYKSRGMSACSQTTYPRSLVFSDEDSSSNETQDDDDSEDDAGDVQKVLEDLFQRMPNVPPGWPWQEAAVGKAAFAMSGIDSLQMSFARGSPENVSKCKEELTEERMPRWGCAETKDFIAIRAEMEMDSSFHSQKNIWEQIATKMKQQGYARSSEQCKRKWKKLVNRYKRKVTLGQDNGRKFLVFQELDDLFKARLQRRELLFLPETNGRAVADEKQLNPPDVNGHMSEDGDSAEVFDSSRKKRKTDSMHQVLSDYVARQQSVEKEWLELLHRKEEEWQSKEREWRMAMESLQQQRLQRETRWREREAQRRAREETRSQEWDKLFGILVNNLTAETSFMS